MQPQRAFAVVAYDDTQAPFIEPIGSGEPIAVDPWP
jgi:hypothetical protein